MRTLILLLLSPTLLFAQAKKPFDKKKSTITYSMNHILHAWDAVSPEVNGVVQLKADGNIEKVAIVAAAGAHRLNDIEMNIRTFFVKVTNDRDKTVEGISSMFGVTKEMIDASPFALIGSVESCIEQLLERRERWGFSYTIVGAENIDECAPIVAALSGK